MSTPDSSADRDERLKQIRVAALLLAGTHSANALARSNKVSVERIYAWRDLALTYADPEADALRQTLGQAGPERIARQTAEAPRVGCLKLGDDWLRIERVTGDRISNATQEAHGLPVAFPDLEELVYLSGRHGHDKMLRVARLALGCGLDRAAALLKKTLTGDDDDAIYRQVVRAADDARPSGSPSPQGA